MSKLTDFAYDTYDKAIDWALAQWFRFWKWQAGMLDARIDFPQPVDTFATTAKVLGLEQTNAKLLRRNQELTTELAWAQAWAKREDFFQPLPVYTPTTTTGPSRPNAKKLTKREVVEIKGAKRSGWTNKALADAYDVNPATISRIVRGIYYGKVAA